MNPRFVEIVGDRGKYHSDSQTGNQETGSHSGKRGRAGGEPGPVSEGSSRSDGVVRAKAGQKRVLGRRRSGPGVFGQPPVAVLCRGKHRNRRKEGACLRRCGFCLGWRSRDRLIGGAYCRQGLRGGDAYSLRSSGALCLGARGERSGELGAQLRRERQGERQSPAARTAARVGRDWPVGRMSQVSARAHASPLPKRRPFPSGEPCPSGCRRPSSPSRRI